MCSHEPACTLVAARRVPAERRRDARLARQQSRTCRLRGRLSKELKYVFDSDLIHCYVIHDGETVHTYVSDAEMLVEWFEDDDGQFRPRTGNVVYPVDFEFPQGPIGDDPAVFAPFAAGPLDLVAVGAALRGEHDEGKVFRWRAEQQHWAIIEALGLPPRALTTAYRHCDPASFPAAVVLQ